MVWLCRSASLQAKVRCPARERAGSTPDEAAAAAGRYMAEVKHIVVAPS